MSAAEDALVARLTARFSGPAYDRWVAAAHQADRRPDQPRCRCPVCTEVHREEAR